MSLDRDGLQRVLDAYDQGKWDEIRLETSDTVLVLSSQGPTVTGTQTSDVSAVQSPIAPAGPASPGASGRDRPAPTSSSSVPATAVIPAEGARPTREGTSVEPGTTIDVVAPSPGIFWRSPSPGAPPFAAVGDEVEPDSVLCIVEIMKLMNTVGAPCPGVVTEVLGINGEQVEQGDVLFRLRVDAS